MIILSQSIGPNYKKITIRRPGVATTTIVPGVCAKINGRWLAVAGYRKDELDFIIPASHSLHNEEITEVEYPVGRGFSVGYLAVPVATAIVGGTGLGAIVGLVEQRSSVGLQTHVMVYARDVKKDQIFDAFPSLKSATTLGCWDTIQNGRPATPLGPLWLDNEPIVFYAGPKSLHAALEVDPRRPKIVLNF